MRWQCCVHNVQPPCPSRLLLLQRSLGKHANERGREICSILILHAWHILWNEWELFSVPLLFLPVFFSSFEETAPSEVWAEAVDTCPTAPPNEKKQKKTQATCSKCGLNSLEAQAVTNRPERVRAWKDKWLLLKHPRMDTKKMAVRVCVFVPVRVSSPAPTGEEELKEGQIYTALTASA